MDENINEEEESFFYNNPGPVPLHETYPQILVEMNCVKSHGFAAHERRRTAIATSSGFTIEDIRLHLLANVEGLNKILRTKVYKLMQPARVNTREAARHKDAVDVLVGAKQCDLSKENKPAHEYFATVSNVRQMCTEFPKETMIFS